MKNADFKCRIVSLGKVKVIEPYTNFGGIHLQFNPKSLRVTCNWTKVWCDWCAHRTWGQSKGTKCVLPSGTHSELMPDRAMFTISSILKKQE